jgi:hypothetical protein
MNEGWICPRCKQINAPWVMRCTCYAVIVPPVPSLPDPYPPQPGHTIGDDAESLKTKVTC